MQAVWRVVRVPDGVAEPDVQALRAKEDAMKIEDRIKAWREAEPGEEPEGYIDLLCDAEEELRRRSRCEVTRSRCIKPAGHGGFCVFEES